MNVFVVILYRAAVMVKCLVNQNPFLSRSSVLKKGYQIRGLGIPPLGMRRDSHGQRKPFRVWQLGLKETTPGSIKSLTILIYFSIYLLK